MMIRQSRKRCQFSKTTPWLIGQGPRACKQDFSHNSWVESHAALVHSALLFCYNLRHFYSRSTNLPGRRGGMGRVSEMNQGNRNRLSVESGEGEDVWTKLGMLRMLCVMAIVVISLVWCWSWGQMMTGIIVMTPVGLGFVVKAVVCQGHGWGVSTALAYLLIRLQDDWRAGPELHSAPLDLVVFFHQKVFASADTQWDG